MVSRKGPGRVLETALHSSVRELAGEIKYAFECHDIRRIGKNTPLVLMNANLSTGSSLG